MSVEGIQICVDGVADAIFEKNTKTNKTNKKNVCLFMATTSFVFVHNTAGSMPEYNLLFLNDFLILYKITFL